MLHGVIYGYVTTTAEPRNLVPDDTRQWLTETHFKSSGIGRQLHAMKICGQCPSIRIIIPRFNENKISQINFITGYLRNLIVTRQKATYFPQTYFHIF